MLMVGLRTGALLLAILVAGCAGIGPYRHADAAHVNANMENHCAKIYRPFDTRIKDISENFQTTYPDRLTFLENIERDIRKSEATDPRCWNTAYEHHDDYDLYYVEFDDAGQATDSAADVPYKQSELYLIENNLRSLLQEGNAGLNIVVFTHGWHGNARATNNYSTEFKAILEDIAAREHHLRREARTKQLGLSTSTHRVVGIEIAWRGDSFLSPAIPFVKDSKNALNVWDRKLAAETVSTGGVQELLAFLNQLYLDNSCHGNTARAFKDHGTCDRIHMLTIGHSFGALIDFRSLISRLESGLNVDPYCRAYGFGDMTILLNPAMEGARYRSLFNTAINRPNLFGPYFGDPAGDGQCAGKLSSSAGEVQIPTIVTLQSLGDTATGTFFPKFRAITSMFAKTLSRDERTEKDNALGWVPAFWTGSLMPSTKPQDECLNSEYEFCPFSANRSTPLARSAVAASSVEGDLSIKSAKSHQQHMILSWDPTLGSQVPNYFPLWVVRVDARLMANHSDFWNGQTVRLISILFTRAYEQSEAMHGHSASAQSKP